MKKMEVIMKKRTMLTTKIIILMLFLVVFNAMAYNIETRPANIIIESPEKYQLAKDYIIEHLKSGYSEYYDIGDILFYFDDHFEGGVSESLKVEVIMETTLKAKSAMDLPMIAGMLDAANLTKYDEVNMVSTINEKNKVTEKEAITAARLIEQMVTDVESCIGKETETYFTFIVAFEKNDYGIACNKLLVEQGNKFVSADEILPEMRDELYNIGRDTFWGEVANRQKMVGTKASYDRLDARDYVNEYVIHNNNANCWLHGTSCGVDQQPSYYNSSYSYYTHNDCANFVSQALKFGGIPTDSNWEPYTSAWINCNYLEDFLVDESLVTSSSNYYAAAGGIFFLGDSSSLYHVEMIVYNDTVTRKSNCHSNDRYQRAYGSSYGYKFYILW
jgi:RNA polymerase sigma-70 factor (ECF subfamily)